jgi:recombinational DNA repair protein (RecF pathway)
MAIGFNKYMIKCINCNAMIDSAQYYRKNGLCIECRKKKRREDGKQEKSNE